MEVKVCEHEWQNTGLTFCTIPESPMQVCIKCGEQRLHQEEIEKQELTDLGCDICQKPMYISKSSTNVIFKCSNPECHQTWQFGENSSGCTVMKHLWPSKMEEGGKMFREQYLPEWLKEKEFHAEAKFIGSIWDESKKEEYLREVHAELDKWHAEHPIVVQDRHWWQFWKAA
jgi:hypothetical protein